MKQQHVVLAFVLGTIFGTLLPVGQVPRKLKRKTMAPFHISNVPETGVSHNPEIKKQVLASYLQLPHVTQVAKSSLKAGQVAAENWHVDMAEMFLFTQGEGILNLDGVNYSLLYLDYSASQIGPIRAFQKLRRGPTKHF